jgi:hypothetical protein
MPRAFFMCGDDGGKVRRPHIRMNDIFVKKAGGAFFSRLFVI